MWEYNSNFCAVLYVLITLQDGNQSKFQESEMVETSVIFFSFWMHSLPLPLCLADLKKTLAVLLDNIMLRLGKLEARVENIYNGTGANISSSTTTATPSATNAEKVNVAGMYSHPLF